MTQSISYEQHSRAAYDADLGHLKTLAICHYVWGGLAIAISSIFIFHIVMGIMLLNGALPMNTPAASGRPPTPQQAPEFLGWIFIGMGSLALLLGWTTGILTILSGRCLARQTSRTFSLVMAGVNCLSVPIGTTLGVFTFIVMFRPSVQALYDQRKANG